MICPKCEEAGLTSRITHFPGECTMGGYFPFSDEKGRMHLHDGNLKTARYECSNGHKWSEPKYNRCWCGWTSEPEAQ